MPLFEPINDKTKGRPYCGPSAIAILTGVPILRAEWCVRRRRRGGYRDTNGRRLPIKGAYNGEVLKSLRLLGCKVTAIKTQEPTLARFVADVPASVTYLVNVTGHYVCVHAGKIADTYTKLKAVPVADYPKPLWRVQRAWRIEAPAVPRYTVADPIGRRPREPKAVPSIQERRAAKVAADLKRWERKEKLAKTKVKALRRKAAYYARALTLQKEVSTTVPQSTTPEA